MECHEVKKDAKIVDEIMTYVIKKGFNDISIDIKRTKEMSTLVFKLPYCELSKSLFESMTHELNQHREDEIEECYWQLLGESDNEYEFDLLGTIIDTVEFEHCDSLSTIKFIRKHD